MEHYFPLYKKILSSTKVGINVKIILCILIHNWRYAKRDGKQSFSLSLFNIQELTGKTRIAAIQTALQRMLYEDLITIPNIDEEIRNNTPLSFQLHEREINEMFNGDFFSDI